MCIDNLWKFLWKPIWPKYRPGNKEYIKMGFIFFWASNNLLWFFKSYNTFFCWRIIRSAKNPRNIRPDLLHAPSRSHRSATYSHWNVDPGLTSQWEQGNSGGAELRQRSGEPRPRTHWEESETLIVKLSSNSMFVDIFFTLVARAWHEPIQTSSLFGSSEVAVPTIERHTHNATTLP